MRCDHEFDNLLKKCTNDAYSKEENETAPEPVRKRKRVAHLSDFIILDKGVQEATSYDHHADCDQESASHIELKRQYFEILDCLTNSMDTRWNQTDFKVVQMMENLILNACNNEKVRTEDAECLESMYGTYWQDASLRDDLTNLPFLLKMYNSDQSHPAVKHVTRIHTVCNVFNNMKSAKLSCPAIHVLLKLYKTIPMSSSTAERSFSALRRLKNWTRARTCANHLNNIMFATIHKKRLDDLDCEMLASEFSERNDRRRSYFGSFKKCA